VPVVIAEALVLAGAVDGVPLSHPRILYDDIFGLSDTTLVASTEATGFPKENAADYLTYDFWKGTADSATLEAQAATAHFIDYALIAAHNMGDVGGAAQFSYHNGSSWVDLTIEVNPGSNRVLAFLFPEVFASRVRVEVTSDNSPANPPNLGVVMAGKALAMQRGQPLTNKPMLFSRKTVFNTNTSEGGQFLGRSVRRQGVEPPLRFENLTAAWVRQHFEPFVTHVQNKGFFGFVESPVDYPNDVAYGTCDLDIQPSHDGLPDRMNVEFAMKGLRE